MLKAIICLSLWVWMCDSFSFFLFYCWWQIANCVISQSFFFLFPTYINRTVFFPLHLLLFTECWVPFGARVCRILCRKERQFGGCLLQVGIHCCKWRPVRSSWKSPWPLDGRRWWQTCDAWGMAACWSLRGFLIQFKNIKHKVVVVAVGLVYFLYRLSWNGNFEIRELVP